MDAYQPEYLYSPWQVTGAAALGGPPTGAWLIANNFNRLGQTQKAKLLRGAAVVITAAMLVLVQYGPRLQSYTLLNALLLIGVRWGAEASYGTTYKSYVANGGRRAAHWRWLRAGAVGMVIILGVLAANVSASGIASRPTETPIAFMSNPRNDKVILVSGWTDSELGRILGDFTTMYRSQLAADFDTNLGHAESGSSRVTFPHDIPPLLFKFLVNYVQYPRGIQLDGRTIVVAGRSTLTRDFGVPDDRLVGQKALIYVPTNDHDYDVVYIRVASDAFYEDSFTTDAWKRVNDARLPPAVESLQQ